MSTEYRVIWEIDIVAGSPVQAATIAQRIQRDPESSATIFTVKERCILNGKQPTYEVDMSDTSKVACLTYGKKGKT